MTLAPEHDLVAKINNCSNETTAPLTDYALGVSKNGKNTLAIVTTHTKRWGKVKGEYSGAFGFGFRLGFLCLRVGVRRLRFGHDRRRRSRAGR